MYLVGIINITKAIAVIRNMAVQLRNGTVKLNKLRTKQNFMKGGNLLTNKFMKCPIQQSFARAVFCRNVGKLNYIFLSSFIII